MTSQPRESSLHTLEDPGASDYLDETLGDGDPLIPPDVNPPPFTDEYYRIPRQADYERHNGRGHQYYIQQSYDDGGGSAIYEESNNCYSLSPVRRMFCLLSLFDCLLVFLMWVIYLQVIILYMCTI